MGESIFERIVKTFDAFSIPVLFTNRRKPFYGTILGGLLTCLIFILMLVYFIILVIGPWSTEKGDLKRGLATVPGKIQEDHSGDLRGLSSSTYNWEYSVRTSKTKMSHDFNYDSNRYNPFQNGFNLMTARLNGQYDPTMVKFVWTKIGEAGLEYLETEYCNKGNFHPSLSDDLDIIGIDYLLCPPSYDSILSTGSFLSNFIFARCDIIIPAEQ